MCWVTPNFWENVLTAEKKTNDNFRNFIFRERKREQAKGGDAKSKLVNRERDITEQIALGLPQKTTGGGEAQFDQRLFNQSRGMDSGFGDDEAYNVYDRPMRDQSAFSNIYRPTRGADSEAYGQEIQQMMANNRFTGATDDARRSGPVEFQPSAAEATDELDKDLFGVFDLLSKAKHAKRPSTGGDRRDDRGGDKRRRRDKSYRD